MAYPFPACDSRPALRYEHRLQAQRWPAILPDVPARQTRTLDRLLSRAGVCSRTAAQRAIAEGRVQVNGRVVRDPEQWIDAGRDVVQFDGTEVRERQKEVWLLHKPTGYVTTASDERGRATVYELLPQDHTWLAPIGRLDRDTSGLLLFTNDSDLGDAITAPASKLPKTYVARCRGRLRDDAIAALAAGVTLRDGPTLPAQVRRVVVAADEAATDAAERTTTLELVLVEGRNRQVRRMLEAIGSEVLTLHRARIGPLELGDLPLGQARPATPGELAALRAAVNPVRPDRPPPRSNRGNAR